MNEEAMKAYLEQNEQRLQRLEDAMSGTPGNPKQPEKDEKQTHIDEFINQMKAMNTAPEPGAGEDEGNNEFIKMMKQINKYK